MEPDLNFLPGTNSTYESSTWLMNFAKYKYICIYKVLVWVGSVRQEIQASLIYGRKDGKMPSN